VTSFLQRQRRWKLVIALLAAPSLGACTGPNPFFDRSLSEAPARSPRQPDAAAAGRDAPARDAPAQLPEDPIVTPAAVDIVDAANEAPEAADARSVDATDATAGEVDAPADTAPAPPPLMPVAHWRLDETSGTQAADATGNGNVGLLAPGATWTTSVFPKARFDNPAALRLDGGGSVAVTPRTLPALAAPKSISAWFWTDGLPAFGRRNLVALVNRTAAASIQLGLDLGRLAVWRWSDSTLLVSRNELTSAGWHHVAYVYDGSEHRLYFDGALADTSKLAALGAPVTSAHLGSFDGTTELFQGRLDDVRIYAQPLTPAAVRALAAGDPDVH
jgi:hypothetical protein